MDETWLMNRFEYADTGIATVWIGGLLAGSIDDVTLPAWWLHFSLLLGYCDLGIYTGAAALTPFSGFFLHNYKTMVTCVSCPCFYSFYKLFMIKTATML
jgi:hypothetical protein